PALVNLGVLNCDLFINALQGASIGAIPGGAVLTLTLTGPATIRLDPSGTRDVAIVAGCPGATLTATSATTVTITAPAGGCPAGTTIQVSQKLQCTANITPGSLSE